MGRCARRRPGEPPIGLEFLTFKLLTRSTHLVPRLLAALTLVAIVLGFAA